MGFFLGFVLVVWLVVFLGVLWVFLGHLGSFYKNLTCNYKTHHGLVKMEVYLAEICSKPAYSLNFCLHVDFINQGLLDRPLMIHTDCYFWYIFDIEKTSESYSNWNSISRETVPWIECIDVLFIIWRKITQKNPSQPLKHASIVKSKLSLQQYPAYLPFVS